MGLTRRIDTFTDSGTWTALAEDVVVSAIGGGGPHGTGSIGGGGGAWGQKVIEGLTVSNNYTVTVPAGAGSGANAGDVVFIDGSTFLVEGGRSSNNGGSGGLAANCVADTAFDGGDGTSGIGGGSAGNIGAAVDDLGGQYTGGSGYASGTWPGGGSGTASIGPQGLLHIEFDYEVGDFPLVKSRGLGREGADTGSHTINLPDDYEAGMLLFCVFAVQGTGGTIGTPTGWTKTGERIDSDNSLVLFQRRATGDSNDEGAITTSNSEQSAHICYALENAGDDVEAAFAIGNFGNPDPPNLSPSAGSDNYLWLAVGSSEFDNGHQTKRNFPSGYDSFLFIPPRTETDGVDLMIAEKRSTASSENPGAFTSATNAWVAATIAIPFVPGITSVKKQWQFPFNIRGLVKKTNQFPFDIKAPVKKTWLFPFDILPDAVRKQWLFPFDIRGLVKKQWQFPFNIVGRLRKTWLFPFDILPPRVTKTWLFPFDIRNTLKKVWLFPFDIFPNYFAVYINGEDVTNIIVNGSFKVRRSTDQMSGSCSFQIRKYGDRTYTPSAGDEILVREPGGQLIFGGVLLQFSRSLEGGTVLMYDLNFVDYAFTLTTRRVSERYTETNVGAVIQDIIAKYRPDIDATGVVSSVEVKSIVFRQRTITECLDDLASKSGYSWYVDYQKVLKFFLPADEPISHTITENSENKIRETLHFDSDLSQIRNRVTVNGGEIETLPDDEEYRADGDQLFFQLANKYAELPTVTVAGVPQTVGVEHLSQEDNYQCFWSYGEKYIRFKETTKPSSNQLVNIAGTPLTRYAIQVQDDNSIQQLGGEPSGIREMIINDTSLRTREDIEARANAELTAYANSIIEAEFSSNSGVWEPGQVVSINLPTMEVEQDFRVQRVDLLLATPDIPEWNIQLVTAKTLNIIEVLITSLKGDNIITSTDEEPIAKIQNIPENIVVSEVIANPDIETVNKVWGPHFPSTPDDNTVAFKWDYFEWQ